MNKELDKEIDTSWYELYRGYKHSEYQKGKGYYCIMSNKWNRNKKRVYLDPKLTRYQFRVYDDGKIERDFGYDKVDRIGYFLTVLRKNEEALGTSRRLKNKFIHIPYSLLHAVLGHQYSTSIIDDLVQLGIIEVKRPQVKGRGSNIKHWFLSLSKEMLESEVRERVVEHVKLNHNVLNVERSIELEGELEYQHELISKLTFSVEHKDAGFTVLIDNKKHSYSTDDFGGRVYTPFNSLKKELRKELFLDGEKLVEFDMVASHWSILYYIMLQIATSQEIPFITLQENLRLKKYPVGRSWLQFYEDCFLGDVDFYRMIGIRLQSFYGVDRDHIKDSLLKDLNGPLQVQSSVFGLDRETYRERVYDDAIYWITGVKSNLVFNDYKGGYYKNIPQLLAKVEVGIMNQVWLKLKKRKIDYLSIHDCVVVKESDVEIAMRVLKTISNQFKGIRFKKK